MQTNSLRKHHHETFATLSIRERLAWALGHGQFLYGLMDAKARALNRKLRRQGKKYVTLPTLE